MLLIHKNVRPNGNSVNMKLIEPLESCNCVLHTGVMDV